MTTDTAALTPKAVKLPSLKPASRPRMIMTGAAFAVAIAALLYVRPNLDLLFAQPLVLQVHVYAALAALGLGAVILLARKGKTFHRTAGWIWSGLMATVAGASLFIVGLNGDTWSWIHLISGYVLLSLPIGLIAARRHKVRLHSKIMGGMYLGGLIIAGAFTFLPGRLMFQVVFG